MNGKMCMNKSEAEILFFRFYIKQLIDGMIMLGGHQ